MKTQADARAAVRRSGVAIVDWAHVLGVSRGAVYKLVKGDPAMQEGPLMQRLKELLGALDSGRVEWQRRPPGSQRGHPYHRLSGGLTFKPTSALWHVDFLHQRLVRGPRQVEGQGAIEALPMRKWFEHGSE